MHEVLVNRLGGLSLPRKSVVRLTDRPDMTSDVYRGRKTTNQHQQYANHINQDYIHVYKGAWAEVISLLYINRLNKTESAIFVSLMCSVLPENLHSELILSSLELVLCRLAAVKRLPVHHHSADYIFSGSAGSLG